MDLDTMYKNIEDFAKMELEDSKNRNQDAGTPAEEPTGTDIYQRGQDRIREVSQKSYPKGASAAVNMATNAVIDGVGAEGLAKAYKRARGDIDALKGQGERGRAEVRRQQYMQ